MGCLRKLARFEAVGEPASSIPPCFLLQILGWVLKHNVLQWWTGTWNPGRPFLPLSCFSSECPTLQQKGKSAPLLSAGMEMHTLCIAHWKYVVCFESQVRLLKSIRTEDHCLYSLEFLPASCFHTPARNVQESLLTAFWDFFSHSYKPFHFLSTNQLWKPTNRMAKVIGATISFLELVSVLFFSPLWPNAWQESTSRRSNVFCLTVLLWRERHVRAACIFSGQEAENEPVSDF